MKNVRLFFKKDGPLKFVSHLDMNRFMTRILRLSGVPIWYTEGFNKHPYITFALPLSLGFFSEYEVMDFRLCDDEFSLLKAEEMIKSVCPKGLEVIALKEPVNKPGKIAFAEFKIDFQKDEAVTKVSLLSFLSGEKIIINKKSKKGELKEIDIADKIKSFNIVEDKERLMLNIVLPAGGGENINPKSVIDEYLKAVSAKEKFYSVTRISLFLTDGKQFC